MLNLHNKNKDKVEVSQKQFEKKLLLHKRIKPHNGHILFEVDLVAKEIRVAKFTNDLTIKWSDALAGNFAKYRKVLKQDNCEYISALNAANCKKIAKRDFNINIDNFIITNLH